MSAAIQDAVEFAKPELTARFRRDGFVVLPGLDSATVGELRAMHARLCPSQVAQMYSNVHDLAREVNVSIASALTDALAPIVTRDLIGYEVRGGTFLVKGRGDDSVCHLHQDWNTVDEATHIALVAWVPLEDVSESNGCLVVAPGSHDRHRFPTVRGANIDDAHFECEGQLAERCQTVAMRSGEVCFFAQNLFHGSGSNRAGADRVALYAGVLPTGVPMVHYLRDGDRKLRRLRVDDDFYYSGEAGTWWRGEQRSLDDLPEVSPLHGTVELSELLACLDAHAFSSGRASTPDVPLSADDDARPGSYPPRGRAQGLIRRLLGSRTRS